MIILVVNPPKLASAGALPPDPLPPAAGNFAPRPPFKLND